MSIDEVSSSSDSDEFSSSEEEKKRDDIHNWGRKKENYYGGIEDVGKVTVTLCNRILMKTALK